MAVDLSKVTVQKGDNCLIVTTLYRDSMGRIRVKVERIPL